MNYDKLEKTYEGMRAFELARNIASFVTDRVVDVPFIIDPGEPTPQYEQLELEYDDQYLNGIAEVDTRSWDVC